MKLTKLEKPIPLTERNISPETLKKLMEKVRAQEVKAKQEKESAKQN